MLLKIGNYFRKCLLLIYVFFPAAFTPHPDPDITCLPDTADAGNGTADTKDEL